MSLNAIFSSVISYASNPFSQKNRGKTLLLTATAVALYVLATLPTTSAQHQIPRDSVLGEQLANTAPCKRECSSLCHIQFPSQGPEMLRCYTQCITMVCPMQRIGSLCKQECVVLCDLIPKPFGGPHSPCQVECVKRICAIRDL